MGSGRGFFLPLPILGIQEQVYSSLLQFLGSPGRVLHASPTSMGPERVLLVSPSFQGSNHSWSGVHIPPISAPFHLPCACSLSLRLPLFLWKKKTVAGERPLLQGEPLSATPQHPNCKGPQCLPSLLFTEFCFSEFCISEPYFLPFVFILMQTW